jgi:hypothetical protein
MADLTAAKIRTRIKDDPTLNILLQGELQNSDAYIAEAMEDAMEFYDLTPPILGGDSTLESFPSNALLFLGVCWKLAAGEAERQLRNNVTYTAQGVNAGIDDKFQQYMALAESYRAQFMSASQEVKKAINISSAWGEVLSPYSAINDLQYRS